MEFILKPFIFVYHIVSKIVSLPKKLIFKIDDTAIEAIDKHKLKEENKGIPENAITNDEEEIEDEPIKLTVYRYYAIDSNGKKASDLFEGESEMDVRNFLLSQNYTVLSVAPRKKYDIEFGMDGQLKSSELAFALTQLSTYIKAGIPLVDSVRILSKQTTDTRTKRAFSKLVHDLLKGSTFSKAMKKQKKAFPQLLINMVKTAELTGDLPSVLDDMADYYTTIERTKKQMVSAMTYPAVVMVAAVAVLIFMLAYLVPQFVTMFESQNAELPAITLFIMNASDFLRGNYITLIIIALVVIVGFIQSYRKIISFRRIVQTVLMKTPVVKNIIIYNEVANFTKTFASLINHGVYITDSMAILSKITNNEIYKTIINKAINNLAKGENISKAFKGEWAFPVVAYEMLITGENTGQLGLMMEKVADHFQNLHKTTVDQIKSLIEPIMITFLAVIVGVILLSIITPMFNIYDQIQ